MLTEEPGSHLKNLQTATKPVSLSPCQNADSIGPSITGDLALKYPMTRIAACCACAASGHTAAPPSNVMNLRRLRAGMGSPPVQPVSRALSLARRDWLVLGPTLK